MDQPHSLIDLCRANNDSNTIVRTAEDGRINLLMICHKSQMSQSVDDMSQNKIVKNLQYILVHIAAFFFLHCDLQQIVSHLCHK